MHGSEISHSQDNPIKWGIDIEAEEMHNEIQVKLFQVYPFLEGTS